MVVTENVEDDDVLSPADSQVNILRISLWQAFESWMMKYQSYNSRNFSVDLYSLAI